MRYSTILIDLDNTILDFNAAEKQAFFKASKDFNIPCTNEMYLRYSKINDIWWKKTENQEYTRDQITVYRFVQYFDEYNIECDPVSFNKTYKKNLCFGRFLIEGATETLKELYTLGCKIYIVSNGYTDIVIARVTGQEFMNYVESYAVSEKIGALKPDIEFFNGVSKEFNLSFNKETIIVGDSLSSDIQGGININIDTCWFNLFNQENPKTIKPTYTINKIDELINICKGNMK